MMKIKKFGHSAIVIEVNTTRILVDPGVWSPGVEDEVDLNAICITHEHPDHFSLDFIKKLLKNNPEATLYTNQGVGKLLDENSIAYDLISEGDERTVNEITFTVHGLLHALIDKDWPRPLNTGFLFNGRLYHPGDALHNPKKPVEILAIPIMAPWARISEMLDYIREIKPKKLFPIHEALLKELGLYAMQAKRVAESQRCEFIEITSGEVIEV